MHILIEHNEFYNKNIEECKKYNYIPITVFKLTLNNKQQIKQDLEQLKLKKQEIVPKYSAIQITIDKLENSTIGTINNLKKDFDITIGLGGLNKINRFLLEQTQINFIQDPQNTLFKPKMDFIHHFNSGMNHILCQFAKDKQIGLIETLNFTYSSKKYIPKEIGRINQNIKFARKYKIPTLINFIVKYPQQIKSIIELQGIMSLFDMSTTQKQESIKILEKTIITNQFKQSKNYITEGIEIVE